MTSRKQLTTYLLMALLLFLWGSFAAVSKWSMRDIDSWQMQFYMFAVALFTMLCMLPFSGRRKQLKSIPKTTLAKLCLYGLFSYLYYAFYTASLKSIPASEASMLNYLFPVLIVLLAVIIEREKLTWPKMFLLGTGLAGTFLIVTSGSIAGFVLTNAAGDLLAVLGAFSWALFTVLGKRDRTPLFASIFVYVVVSFVCSAVSLFLFSEWTVPEPPVLAGIVWLSLSNIVFAYFIWFRILQMAPVALVSGMSYITPFVTLMFIFVLLGERVTLVQGAGFLLIMAGVLLYRRLERE